MKKRKEISFNEKEWSFIERESKKLNLSTSEFIKSSCSKNVLLGENIRLLVEELLNNASS